MKKYLFVLAAAAVTAASCCAVRHCRREIDRLQSNQQALTRELVHYRTRAGAEAASSPALRLRCAEYESLRADDAARIRELGIRIRRLEAAATLATRQETAFAAPLRDTVIVRQCDTLVVHDTVRLFRWNDAWCSVEGRVQADSVSCRVESIDTLRQIVHRVPRKFLFFRWGTKAIRQEIVASNPHTRIVYAEYVQITR